MPAIYEFCHVVQDDEIDPQGHVNNLEYLKWMQTAAVDHSAAQGWPGKRYREIGGGWVARKHTIEYLQPAFAGEKIIVRTWVAGFRKVSSLRKYRVVRPTADTDGDGNEAETVLAVAETLWAFIGLQRHVPRRIPPEVVDAFDIVAAEPGGGFPE